MVYVGVLLHVGICLTVSTKATMEGKKCIAEKTNSISHIRRKKQNINLSIDTYTHSF